MPMFPALQYTRKYELYTPISQYFGILTSYAMRTNFFKYCINERRLSVSVDIGQRNGAL